MTYLTNIICVPWQFILINSENLTPCAPCYRSKHKVNFVFLKTYDLTSRSLLATLESDPMKNVLLSRPLKAARKTHPASHPRKSLSSGIALPCNGHPITVGGRHTGRKHGPKLKCYSPEFLVVTSDRIKSNLQLRATQYQRFGAFPRFRMVHLESPNHICLTGCAQTYRLVSFFFMSDISMS